ncbi:hypothetical protein DH2020_009447 [Rehmannia glutinosa]|uniref:UspA domain-containing protein n=1 Tax=Rehmannia glutinosa TaxID=99300 RepID=A0ABR0X6Z7_REHGL
MAVNGGEPTKIMVAINESNTNGYQSPSRSCAEAFEWALKRIVRNNTSGFKILLLHVQLPYDDGLDVDDTIYCSPEDVAYERYRDVIGGLRLLQYFLKKCNDVGVPCEAWLKKGDPKKIICLEAKRVKPDFLVVGRRGLSFLQKLFFGSVSDYCAKHADCPVIVVKRSPSDNPKYNAFFD